MKRYRHRELAGVEVTAEVVNQDTYAPLAHMLGAHVVKEVNKETGETFMGLNVLTSAGYVRASEGTYVVDSAVGIFVLTPAHFEQKYEEIKEETDHLGMTEGSLFLQRGGKINGEN